MTLSREIAEWLTAWSQTADAQALMAGLPTDRAGLAAAVPRLRKGGLTAEQTSAVVELVELRQRAKSKFPAAEQLFFTRRGYEQSSGQALAAWKVACLQRQWPEDRPLVVDLCCGVGGDLREFARDFPSLGVERDPAVAHFAEANLLWQRGLENGEPPPARVFCGPLETLLNSAAVVANGPSSASATNAGQMGHWPEELRGWIEHSGLTQRRLVWHLDPDRRDATGRHTRWEELSPGPEVVGDLLRQWGPGVVKLAPATEISPEWQARGHWQWLGWARECKQLLGWFDCESQFPAGQRSVVVWDRDRDGWQVWPSDSQAGADGDRRIATAEPQALLFEPHGAFYAARLAEALAAEQGWRRLTGGDYFTGETAGPSLGELCAAFEVLEVLPLRLPTVRAWLEQRAAVVTELKSRKVPERQAAGLREWVGRGWGTADGPHVSLLLFSVAGGALRVAVCRRLGPDS